MDVQPEAIANQVIVGISSGMILFIVASGLSLIFGVMRVINFAHGSLYMLGAYLAVFVAGYFAEDSPMAFYGALLFGPLMIAFVGLVMETTLFKRIYKKEHLSQLLLTYGLTLIIADLIRMKWGGKPYRLQRPEFLMKSTKIDSINLFGEEITLGLRILKYDIFLIGVGLILVFLLWFLLRRTRWGRMMRASVHNPEMVSALGVNVHLVSTGVFVLGAWLAGFGGALVAARQPAGLDMASNTIVQAFAVVVIGGLGSILGALLGSLLVGITLSVGILWYPNQAQALPFLVMALVLIVRPWGLLGKPER